MRTQTVSIEPGFRPNGRALGIYEKSENFNSLRPTLFELSKKIAPPPNQQKYRVKKYKVLTLTEDIILSELKSIGFQRTNCSSEQDFV